VTAVEAFREPEHRRQSPDRLAALALEVAKMLVTFLRRALPVVARDKADDFDFVRLEATQVAVLDQIVRVLVMALVTDMDADVVQQRRVLEPLALAVRQAVHHPRLIEEER
jgi:hypothetical protein